MACSAEYPLTGTREAALHLRASAEDAGGRLHPEVIHPEWLANPVIVPKANGKLRMCVDYNDLNKACPNNPFLLPRIDQVVDSTAGCVLLSFLDYYSGYHQIALKESDQEKTSFMTPFEAYCYNTMTFGLKNAGATYPKAI